MRYTTEQIQQMRDASEARDAVYDLSDYFGWKTLAEEMIRRMTGDEARSFLEDMEHFEAERYMHED
jgi:predicted component of type VI protein secretion system